MRQTMSKEINSENVKEFLHYMARSYDVQVFHKGDEVPRLIKWVARRVAKVRRAEVLLDKRSLTVPGKIWLSFVPGEGSLPHLINQILTIIEEFEHILQWRDDRFSYLFRYVISPSQRAYYERKAYSARMEMAYAMGVHVSHFSPASFRSRKAPYLLREGDVKVAIKALRAYQITVQKGGRSSSVVKHACEFLEL
jgi:hypothetical protein